MGEMAQLAPAEGCSWRAQGNRWYRYTCRIKGCRKKNRNGRCRLPECHIEVVSETGTPTGRCQEFETWG